MSQNTLILAVSIVLLTLFYTYRYYAFRRRLPPGPRGLPFIGNLHQAPKSYPWRTYAEWHKKYGPVFSLPYGLETIIMIGTQKAAQDLLNNRSNIYSSRPRMPMVGECVSRGNRSLILPYGNKWRAYHRLQGSFLSPRMSDTYRELQDLESKQLVKEFLTQTDFSDRFHRYSSSLTFALAYGKRMPSGDEPEVTGVDKIMSSLNAVFIKMWIVDSLPFLNVLPKLLAPWKRTAEKLHRIEVDFFMGLKGSADKNPSWNWSKEVSSIKESQTLTDVELSYVIGNTYEAGSDTTTMALEIFVMAAVLYPEAMRKAQEEIDRVVGRERLPSFDDNDRLPYVHGIVKEVHRWRPVIPGGVPHSVTQDDVYNGYHIPKNATVIGNHWAISMDPEIYDNPEDFNPDRWIENQNLPPLATFGFGRRRCIGKSISDVPTIRCKACTSPKYHS